jgi:Kinesin motor domain
MSDNIKVAVRIRPLNDREINAAPVNQFMIVNQKANSVQISVGTCTKQFIFDFVGDENTTQEDLFESIGKPISVNCLTGYNSSIFAYGQTGAGKTHTIMGDFQAVSLKKANSGILPRCLEYIFTHTHSHTKNNPSIEYLIKCSFLEIYNEQIHDLLAAQPRNLQIREDIKKGAYVEDLIQETVSNLEETFNCLREGLKNRHVSSTAMNKESSRSHSVFTLYIESKEKKNEIWNFKSSLFHLIDLAGSERQKAADTHGERLKEASMINRSLSTLGNVINSLVEISEGKNRYVRYRDSRLTFLLKDSLGGNSKTCIIANISPSILSYGETLSTLRFAERAKYVKNQAVINEDSIGTILELKEEVNRLKNLLKLNSNQYVNLVDIKKINDLETLLAQNLKIRIQTESNMQRELENKENYLKSLMNTLEKYERKMQGDKMTIKLREDTIKRLQNGQKVPESVLISELQQEIQAIRRENENHPIAAKYFVENDALKHYIVNLENEISVKPTSLTSRLKSNQDFTEKLNQYLEETIKDKAETETKASIYEKKLKGLEKSLEDSYNHINDLSNQLETERSKVLNFEENSVKLLPHPNFDKENSGKNAIMNTIKLSDINIKPPESFNKKEFKPEVCDQCHILRNKIIVLENKVRSLYSDNTELKYYEEESYRLAEDLKKIGFELEKKDVSVEELINENQILLAENEFLSTQILDYSSQISEKDVIISELNQKNSYSDSCLDDNILLRDQINQANQRLSYFQSQYIQLTQDMKESVISREQIIEELRKLQNIEYSLRKECDELKTKLNETLFDNNRLKKDYDDLNKEIIKLSGHNNHSQKISYLAKIKYECNVLKEENSKLKDELKKKSESNNFFNSRT